MNKYILCSLRVQMKPIHFMKNSKGDIYIFFDWPLPSNRPNL